MNSLCDVIIIGGGGIGSAVAYNLKAVASKGFSVTVIEKDSNYQFASTTLSAGGIRQHFSTAENILMSRFGHDFMTSAAGELETSAGMPDFDLRPRPYLHIGGEEHEEHLRQSFDLQMELGACPVWLTPDELEDRFPWMSVSDIYCAVLGGPEEGTFDPYTLMQAYRKKAISLGADYLPGEVVAIDRAEGGAGGTVVLSDGTRVKGGSIVNAAGPFAQSVARMAGLELPVTPVQAHSFVFDTQNSPGDIPIVVDLVQKINFKPEGNLFLAGSPREAELVSSEPNFEINYDIFDSILWPALASRVQKFEAIKMVNAWVGLMAISDLDCNPIIGPHPEWKNFYFVNGFSGHGAQHIPAVGRAMSELLLNGAFETIDLSRFGYERILAGEPITEHY